RARKIQTEARRLGPFLKRLEDLLTRRDSGPAVGKTNRDYIGSGGNGNIDRLSGCRFEGPLAILGQIQQNLQEAMSIRMDEWQLGGNRPAELDFGFFAHRLQHDSKIGEEFMKVYAAGLGSCGALLEFERRNLIQGFDQ